MIPLVCFSSLLFGNWPLKWNEKNQRYEICYYFYFTSFVMLFCFCYSFFKLFHNDIMRDSLNLTNPQYLIVALMYLNFSAMTLNRLVNAGHSARFADELKRGCDRTVESGRHLPEFWFRNVGCAAFLCMMYYRFHEFTDLSTALIFQEVMTTLGCCMYCGSTMECLYAAACGALARRFASVNRRTGELARELGAAGRCSRAARRDHRRAADRLAGLSAEHCRLVRLVRLFNDEYGVPIFLTTTNLLMTQIYALNDVVSVIVGSDTFEASYERYEYMFDVFTWTFAWFRLWWICYRADDLVTRVHLTAKIMLENDINSFPENIRKMALDFLDQLLHRHVRITAWGFFDVNKELLFVVLGYQFGLCLICTQFTTSGLQLVNNFTIYQNSTTSMEKHS